MSFIYKMNITNCYQSTEMISWINNNIRIGNKPKFQQMNAISGDTIIFTFDDDEAVLFKLRWL